MSDGNGYLKLGPKWAAIVVMLVGALFGLVIHLEVQVAVTNERLSTTNERLSIIEHDVKDHLQHSHQ